MKTNQLTPFALAYLTAALWTNDDDAGSGDYVETGRAAEMLALVSPEAVTKAADVCAAFQAANSEALEACGLNEEQAGHDLWLTRNRHGSGYWDRTRGDLEALAKLTDAAHALGQCDLYKGDDGQFYFSP